MNLSIIIPYYNAYEYIEECIGSVLAYKGKYSYEIIIINDGSIDLISLKKLNEIVIKYPCITLEQENKGPGAARNLGVKHCKGEYLLFLDSDNKIKEDYIDKALGILENDNSISVVYSRPHFFGVGERKLYEVKPFDSNDLLHENFIDMCSFVRKSKFEEVNGFREDFRIWEDWDLWLSIYEKGGRFHFLDDFCFYYRVRNSSLIGSDNIGDMKERKKQFILNHFNLYFNRWEYLEEQYGIYQNDKKKPFRSLIKYLYYKLK